MRWQISRDDAGIALMTTLMVMLLLSALLVGFTTMVANNVRIGGVTRGTTDGFYAAHAGVEQLTSDLGALFESDPSPSGDAIRAYADTPPSLPQASFLEPDDSDGYGILFETDTGDPTTGDPVAQNRTVTGGPFAGFSSACSPSTRSMSRPASTTVRKAAWRASCKRSPSRSSSSAPFRRPT